MVSIVTNILSFSILCVFFYGRSLRKTNVSMHWRIMAGVIGADVLLILFLVFGRSALSKVSPDMPLILMVHIFFALSTVVLYGLATYFGIQLLKGHRAHLKSMRRVDRVLTPFRVLTLITSVALMFF
jgi:hypothetical protein